MNKEIISGTVGTVLSATGTALQTNEILQTISLIITIIGGLITFIIVPLLNWYSKAKDKKSEGGENITKDELKEGIKTGVEGIKEFTESVKTIDKKHDKE